VVRDPGKFMASHLQGGMIVMTKEEVMHSEVLYETGVQS
jgi:hypothetical protein